MMDSVATCIFGMNDNVVFDSFALHEIGKQVDIERPAPAAFYTFQVLGLVVLKCDNAAFFILPQPWIFLETLLNRAVFQGFL